jgi:hypothetical protein
MKSAVPARRFLALAAIATTAILAGCAEPKPPVVAPPPPPPPPAVSLSSKMIDHAAAYRAYVDRASLISPAFADGAAVAQSLRIGESYEPQQLLRGAIAYGAVVALQDPTFRAGVRTYAVDAEQRRTIAYEIIKDPAYVLGINGAASAAGLVTNALGEDGKKLLAQGRAVKQAAYDVQHFAWSKSEISGRESRLAMAKQLSATPIAGDGDMSAKLQQAVTGAQPLAALSANPAAPPFTPLVVRALAVGALAALGYGEDGNLEQIIPLTAEPNSAQCLNMSKLNLYQCLAVSKPHYEDVFCLGQHVMIDTGACLMKGVGMAEPPLPPPPPKVVPVSNKTPVKKSKARKHKD